MKEEILPRRMSNLQHLVLIGSTVVACATGVYAGYLTTKHDSLGHVTAYVTGMSYEKRTQEAKEKRIFNFFDKYDLNRDGSITKEEYKTILDRK